jgi:Restriction Enzyme Adenine Methylase Associated
MTTLGDALTQVRTRIGRYGESKAIGEENTKGTLIDPILRALGWQLEDMDEVHREFKRKPADKPVDYALFVLGTSRLFLEAKAFGGNLDDRRWAHQIMGYAVVAGAKWVVLTDGNEYRIYNAHAEVPVEEKLFRTARIVDEDSHPEETLVLLSKDWLRENRPEALWKAEFVDRQVKAAIEDIFSAGPTPALVRLVEKRLRALPQREIRSSLSRVRVRLDFRVEPSVRPSKKLQAAASRQKRIGGMGPLQSQVSLEDLIRANIIRSPLELERTYKGNSLTARVETDGRVTCLGRRYDSLSTAAAMARFSIIGAPPGRKYPQTNGWTFWRFRNEAGETISVDVLRQRYLKRREGQKA